MNSSTVMARQALHAALEMRRRAGVARMTPVCVYDLAEQLGIEVKFRPEKSLEGMYIKGAETERPVILISTHRPPGRQCFTCAHELGHHSLDHGTRVDDYVEGQPACARRDPNESMADLFAASLLMPIAVVRQAFHARGWDPAKCTAVQAYTVAGYLGVGYEAIIHQMRWTLDLLPAQHADMLIKMTPKEIRLAFLGQDTPNQIIVVDRAWVDRAVDIQVGDLVLLPAATRLEGASVEVVGGRPSGLILTARKPGVSRVEATDQDWAAFVRVQRHEYIGRSIFRHREDPDENV
jgi:Zn-dependent peptidase ImmA (M78 family)